MAASSRRRDQVERSAPLAPFNVERERERIAHPKRIRVRGSRQVIIADSAAERSGPRRGHLANLKCHRGSDRNQSWSGVIAVFRCVHEGPFHKAGPQRVAASLFGGELAFELVDEIIDRSAVEAVPALRPLYRLKTANRGPSKKEPLRVSNH